MREKSPVRQQDLLPFDGRFYKRPFKTVDIVLFALCGACGCICRGISRDFVRIVVYCCVWLVLSGITTREERATSFDFRYFVCTTRLHLFTAPLGVSGRLCSLIVALPGHFLYHPALNLTLGYGKKINFLFYWDKLEFSKVLYFDSRECSTTMNANNV